MFAGLFAVASLGRTAHRRPDAPPEPAVVEIPAGGIVDFNGNPIETPFTATFTTLGR